MSTLKTPPPAKLIINLIFKDIKVYQKTLTSLTQIFGPLDFISEALLFEHTDYYYKEMGGPLSRCLLSFEHLISPDELSAIKVETNSLEKKFAQKGKRGINIDPGYLTPERLVLATGKNYTHRIYLRDGVYADLTLIYQSGEFQPLPWTYLDYASEPLKGLLELIRKNYLLQRKKGTNHGKHDCLCQK